jgi:hypothetical protein
MEDVRYTKELIHYRPIGRRRPGRPFKRELDGYIGEAETGDLLGWICEQKKMIKGKGKVVPVL